MEYKTVNPSCKANCFSDYVKDKSIRTCNQATRLANLILCNRKSSPNPTSKTKQAPPETALNGNLKKRNESTQSLCNTNSKIELPEESLTKVKKYLWGFRVTRSKKNSHSDP